MKELGSQKLGEKSHAYLEMDVHRGFAGIAERSRTASGGITAARTDVCARCDADLATVSAGSAGGGGPADATFATGSGAGFAARSRCPGDAGTSRCSACSHNDGPGRKPVH